MTTRRMTSMISNNYLKQSAPIRRTRAPRSLSLPPFQMFQGRNLCPSEIVNPSMSKRAV
jgi:hypothetical protein